MGEGWGEGEARSCVALHRQLQILAPRASRLAPQPSGPPPSAFQSCWRCSQARTQQPPVQVPAQYAQRAWTREEALVELVRGRLEGLGPTTAAALAESLGVPHSDIDIALLALEGEGFAMRGSFTPRRRRHANGASAACWRASTATRSSACARRSSRSAAPISCASCSTGSTSRPTSAWKGPTRSPR